VTFALLRQITANRYPKRIHYGNRTPYYARDGTPLPTDWCFHVVFDYGEHDCTNPRPEEDTTWTARPDPFSSYRSGFEIRTYRTCQRVLMFHHFPDELDAQPSLVRATHFTYSFEQQPGDALNPIYTFLVAVKQVGYRKNRFLASDRSERNEPDGPDDADGSQH
jgi:virulence plasmid B protein